MLQWSPDNLELDESNGTKTQLIETPDFIEDRPTGGAASFLSRLEREERDSLFEMIENDVRGEIEQELYSQYGGDLEVLHATIKPLTARVEQAVASELNSIARGTVELAIALGERLARQSISTDDNYIVRCVQELLDRTVPGAGLTIIASPPEIAKLKKCQSDLDDLNVVSLVPDPTIELGGCIVQASVQEWDLTFRGQADALADQVRDAIIYGGSDLATDQLAPPAQPVDKEPAPTPENDS